MRAETVEWLTSLRRQASEPGTIFIVIRGRRRSLLIYPEEVLGMTDEALLEHIRRELSRVLTESEPEEAGIST